ncbi:site-specific integrase [Vibrio parahaemolyticus]|uniref:site-specific integrase n=1 Tax=Vibrio parahaemolyticus TaxID=670 RepID=UPI00084A947C|nr:site-specific integrase [Vibrio parahaemolyticus]EGR2249985.1 site-specific integrase [Vibrio parahaemolyticus]ODX85158.1 hypothetical protein BBM92_14240 [Vibrio parahaemolyticus]ODY08700.1 hypothetical protein BBM15_21135 [Vibrio parahaemolyticus]
MMVALNNIDIIYNGGDKKQQIISIFNEKIIINRRFIQLINDDDQQIILALSSGIEGAKKERKYILSDYYIPYRGESVPITQTPFILPLLKHLNMLVDTFPPTSNQSHKSFQDNVRISLLCIEYFSINGCTSIESVGERLVKTFKEEIINGWYSALKIKQRWDALTNETRSRNWFIKRSEISKKSGSDYAFNLMEFRQSLGTAIFGRSLNDIPDEIVEEMVLPEKLRTPYKYNGNITSEHGFSSRYFLDSFVTINSLFFYSGLDKPIPNPEALSNEMATTEPSRTKMPSIFEVTSTIRFLYQVVAQHQTIAKSLVDVKNIILDPELGKCKRQSALEEVIFGKNFVQIGKKQLAIVGYRQLRESTKEKATNKFGNDFISLGEAYKIFIAAIANLSLIYTGWRLEEIVNKNIGIKSESFKLDTIFNLTEIYRYVQKEGKEITNREKAVVGPFVGHLLNLLDEVNERVAVNYEPNTPLFAPKLASVDSANTSLAIEYAGSTMQHNPLRALALEEGIKIPTPKQLRRYFAVAYFYQFDNPYLLALSKHYGHGSIETTEIYVTDADSRSIAKGMRNAIPVKMLPSRSDMEDSQFRKIFNDARDSKLRDLVSKALEEKSHGGFQAICRAMFKKLYSDVDFKELAEDVKEKAAKDIAVNLKNKGYSVEVFNHGNCTNSEKIANSTEGNCVNKTTGDIERQHAEATLCKGCAFHDVQVQHIENLKVERDRLNEELDDSFELNEVFGGGKTPLEIKQIKQSISELDRIIELYEQESNIV